MYRVLYVDDEPELLEIARLFLEESGEFTVITATSAKDALVAGDLASYDAIISDYQMPDMDGLTFLRKVRSGLPEIPFILFTGRGREEVVMEALNNGADFYLQKGGDPKAQFVELIHKVRRSIQRRKAEEQIIIKNRLYSVLSATNKAIVHIRNKPEFFSEICRVLVEIGMFRMVWIGIEHPGQKKITPVASSGYIDGYLDTIDISTEDVPRGRGPTGTAYREKKPYYSNDILLDPRMEPWRTAALQRGYLANAAFPFALGTPNAGVISLYAPEKGFFSEPVLSLLEELARDISFALSTIDNEKGRVSAEEALRLSEDRLVQGEIISGTGTWELQPDSGKITLSAGAVAIYGMETTTLSLSDLRTTIPLPEYRPMLSLALDQLIQHGTPYNLEFKIRAQSDGSIRDIQSRAIYDSHKNRVIGIIHDITDRKRTEERLLQSNRMLSVSLKAANAGTWDWDFPTGILTWSPEFFELFALPSNAQPSFETWLSTLHPDDREPAMKKIDQSVKDHSYLWNEYRILLPDGTIRWIGAGGRTMYDESGSPLRMSGVCIDITGRIKTEEALRQSEEKFRAVSENSPDHVIIQDRDLRYTYVLNPQLGLTAEAMIGKTDYDILAKEDADALTGIKRKVLDSGIATEYDTSLPSLTGTTEYFEGSLIPKLNTHGECDGLIGYFKNVTERKQAEIALRDSEEKYRMLIHTLNEGVWVIDKDSITTFVNPKMENILGYLPGEMLGKSLFSFMDEEGRRIAENNVERRKRGIKEQHDFEFLKKDGTRIYAILEATPILGTEGEYLGAIAGVSDITERKLAEGALRETETKFSTVFLATPVPLTLVSAVNGAFVDVNTAFLESSGYTREEIIGRTADELGLFPALHEYQQMVATLMEQRRVQGMTVHVRTKYGLTMLCRFSIELINMGGTPHFLSTVEDITERRNAENALKESEERFRSLVTDLQDGVVILGPDGMALFANPAAFRMMGMDPSSESLPINISTFIDPESLERVISDLHTILYEGRGLLSKYRICTVTGQKKWVEASGSRINYRGSFADLVTVRDITEREEAERALAEANKKLQLLGSITRHDIRNKIMVTLGYISMMKKKSADPVVLEYVTKLESAANAIGSQIEFTRVYQDLGTHDPRWQNLDALLPRAHLPETISLKTDSTGLEILADPMIEKVFFNLLDNSIRHGSHVTEISARTNISGNVLTIFWEDNGVGIPANEKEIIFERGFGKNTGLGMFLSREILSLTGITIKETGVPGEGARFEIAVPKGMWR